MKNINYTELFVLQVCSQLEQVIFADIVACKNDDGSVLFCFQPLETIG